MYFIQQGLHIILELTTLVLNSKKIRLKWDRINSKTTNIWFLTIKQVSTKLKWFLIEVIQYKAIRSNEPNLNRIQIINMAFISRYGTQEVHFIAQIQLQKLCLNIDAPEILVQVLLQRGERKIMSKTPSLLSNYVAIFEETLELPLTLYYDQKARNFKQKIGILYILLQGARGIKKAGEVTIDFSEFVQNNQVKVCPLEKCIDDTATFQFRVNFLDREHRQISPLTTRNPKGDQNSQINSSQLEQVDRFQGPIIEPAKISETRKFTKQEQRVIDVSQLKEAKTKSQDQDFDEASQKNKQTKSTVLQPLKKSLLDDQIDAVDIQISKPKKGNKQDCSEQNNGKNNILSEQRKPTQLQQTSDGNVSKQIKEDMKYQSVELGQLRYQLDQSKGIVAQQAEQIRSLREQLISVTEEKMQLERLLAESQQRKPQQAKKTQGNEQPFEYGQPQQLQLEIKRQAEQIKLLQQQRDELAEQVEDQWSGNRNSDIGTKLQQRIDELEEKLKFQPDVSENVLSKLSVENEQLKRKNQQLQENHRLEINKLNEETEDAIAEALQNHQQELEMLRPYKDKYELMVPQFHKLQSELENLRMKKYDTEDKFQETDTRVKQLESELLKVKQKVAGAMQELLNYGDSTVIEIMEFYMA